MSRVTTRLLGLVAAFVCAVIMIAVNPGTAQACSCAVSTPDSAYRNADAVFQGTVTKTTTIKQKDQNRIDYRFTVDSVYKGSVFADQVVASGGAGNSCGVSMTVGSHWIIYATEGTEGSGDLTVSRLITSACSGNLPADRPPRALGSAREPLPGPSDRAEKSVTTDRRVSRGLTWTGIGLGGLVVLAGVGLALVWRTGRRSG